jgi:hypothetical protein
MRTLLIVAGLSILWLLIAVAVLALLITLEPGRRSI